MRLTRLVIAVLLTIGVMLAVATDAAADPPQCEQYNAQGICIIFVQQPGGGGSSTSPQPTGGTGGGGSGTTAPSCTHEPEGTVIPCQTVLGWWVQSRQCYAAPVTPPPPKTDPAWDGHTNGAIYTCSFYEPSGQQFPGTNGFSFWSATLPAGQPVIDPAVLARQALQTLKIPSPTTGRYPAGSLRDGTPYTVVRAYTWYWTDGTSFKSLTARADAGGVWAEVTVEPLSLSFTPGDGASAVSCAGPGTEWKPSYGPWAASPAGCAYQYPHSSIHMPNHEVTATYAIDWAVTWTASTGTQGTLPDITTTAQSIFAVAEVESVVTH